jgi:tetratricopeptide (TPR) repeat protein
LQNTAAGLAEPVVPAVAPPPPKRAPKRTTIARDSASALAVSELLHVTEEARVYVALGRPERAIEVLNEHIRQVPRSMPAAWLMLLHLYHASGRPQDFRRLAEEFHLHCNVQAPLWESFGSSEYEEGGLETFPHIQREVTRIWREPGCREYLENLLYDNREGRRMGFPLAAYGEILLLLQILDAPPPVDIDSDLVQSGKLEAIPKPAAAGTSAAVPAPAESARTAPAGALAAARNAAQRPLDLEPDRNEAAAGPAKKPSS